MTPDKTWMVISKTYGGRVSIASGLTEQEATIAATKLMPPRQWVVDQGVVMFCPSDGDIESVVAVDSSNRENLHV